MQAIFVFIILFLTIAINLPHSIIARLGFHPDILIAALASVVITGLIRHRQLFLIILVIFCSIMANMPEDIMLGWGLDKDIFFGILVAMVLLPIGMKVSGR